MDPQLLAVLLGGAILSYTAWREYSRSDSVELLKSAGSATSDQLKNIRMSALTTVGEYNRGRAWYVFLFLAVYIIFLSSVEIREVFLDSLPSQTNAPVSEVPHTSLFSESTADGGDAPNADAVVTEAESTNDTQLPILLALGIIAGVSSPTFRPIDSAIRKVAYTFAGVPRNIHRVLNNLDFMDYEKHAKSADMPLTEALDDKTSGDPTKFADHRSTISSITDALRIIDLLHDPIIGPRRNVFWNLFAGDAPTERVDELLKLYDQIRRKIRRLSDPIDDIDEELIELRDLANKLSGLMKPFFAVYAIRTKFKSHHRAQNIEQVIIKEVTGIETHQSINDIIIACVVGLVFALPLMWMYGQFAAQAGIGPDETLPSAAATADAVFRAMIAAIPSVFGAASFTIWVRHLRFDQGNWELTAINRLPFKNYIVVALWGTLFGVTLYAVCYILSVEGLFRSFVSFDFDAFRVNSIAFLFSSERYLVLCYMILTLFILPFALLIIADQHQHLKWYITCGLVAAPTSVLFFVLAFTLGGSLPNDLGRIDGVDRAVLVSIPLAVITLVYAAAAEISENIVGTHGAKLRTRAATS